MSMTTLKRSKNEANETMSMVSSLFYQFTVIICSIKVENDWNRTWVLQCLKQLLCQPLCHNHCPSKGMIIQSKVFGVDLRGILCNVQFTLYVKLCVFKVNFSNCHFLNLGQSYKHFMVVIYDSRVIVQANFQSLAS